ncbi:cytochrome b5-like heme/steroid binding domain-containing protein [Gaertneriomyces semiglobifer]|nr:cytochrome b5-like heme/steroid binding domain-containing protein [Gaertneriomyces semiglobifer]
MSKSFTPSELAEYDGTDVSKPVYLAIKGTVFDVSKARDMYAPGAGYHVFAGKDASRALAKSSLKPVDCIPDTSNLSDDEQKTLDKWEAHYRKKYEVVGSVTDSNGSA